MAYESPAFFSADFNNKYIRLTTIKALNFFKAFCYKFIQLCMEEIFLQLNLKDTLFKTKFENIVQSFLGF